MPDYFLVEVCSPGYHDLSSVNLNSFPYHDLSVSLHWTPAKVVHYTKSLGVMKELLNSGVVTGIYLLAVSAGQKFSRILAQVAAQECKLILFHLREREHVA